MPCTAETGGRLWTSEHRAVENVRPTVDDPRTIVDERASSVHEHAASVDGSARRTHNMLRSVEACHH